MKFVILDQETTEIDPLKGQVLEIAAIIADFNTEPNTWPVFHRIVRNQNYYGSAYAIQMNDRIFKILSGVTKSNIKISDHYEVMHEFYQFLVMNGFQPSEPGGPVTPIFAGKNPKGFDIPFMKTLPYYDSYITEHHRSLDPVTEYTDFYHDVEPPSLSECKKRLGVEPMVTHNALDDAFDIAILLAGRNNYPVEKIIDHLKTLQSNLI